MLVLSRFVDQSIVIGEGPDAVTVTVVAIRSGGKVRIGIDAPRHVAVDRVETRARKDYDRLRREGGAA